MKKWKELPNKIGMRKQMWVENPDRYYERPCNQEDRFTLFKKKVIPILLFGFYKN